jgi:hypothetical protein
MNYLYRCIQFSISVKFVDENSVFSSKKYEQDNFFNQIQNFISTYKDNVRQLEDHRHHNFLFYKKKTLK